jgi:hypothetical protein
MIECSIATRRRSALNVREETSVRQAEVSPATKCRKAEDTEGRKSGTHRFDGVPCARGIDFEAACIESGSTQGKSSARPGKGRSAESGIAQACAEGAVQDHRPEG